MKNNYQFKLVIGLLVFSFIVIAITYLGQRLFAPLMRLDVDEQNSLLVGEKDNTQTLSPNTISPLSWVAFTHTNSFDQPYGIISVSPTGEWILSSMTDTADIETYMLFNTITPQRYFTHTSTQLFVNNFKWSPDGTSLTATGFDVPLFGCLSNRLLVDFAPETSDLFSSYIESESSSEACFLSAWSPNGLSLAVYVDADHQAYIYTREGHLLNGLNWNIDANGSIADLFWLPSGIFALTHFRDKSSNQTTSRLYKLDLATNSSSLVLELQSTWQLIGVEPHGDSLLLAIKTLMQSSYNYDFFILDVDTQQKERLFDIEASTCNSNFSSPQFTAIICYTSTKQQVFMFDWVTHQLSVNHTVTGSLAGWNKELNGYLFFKIDSNNIVYELLVP